MRKVVSREPWWATPPTPGQPEAEIDWGWLVMYDQGPPEFIAERPTDEEISNRKSCRNMPAAPSE